MATFKECDRCGKRLSQGESGLDDTCHVESSQSVFGHLNLSVRRISRGYDLCPGCFVVFREWVNPVRP